MEQFSEVRFVLRSISTKQRRKDVQMLLRAALLGSLFFSFSFAIPASPPFHKRAMSRIASLRESFPPLFPFGFFSPPQQERPSSSVDSRVVVPPPRRLFDEERVLVGEDPLLLTPLVNFCALFDPLETDGAKGAFSLALSPSTFSSRNSLALDLTEFSGYDASTCNLSNGLALHIHALWADAASNSSSNVGCSASTTGGHYDPGLSCSPSSDSREQCELLNRTAKHGYTYLCNPDAFNVEGAFFSCEVGDITGKLGTILPTFIKRDVLPDGASIYQKRIYRFHSLLDRFAPMLPYHNAAGVTKSAIEDGATTAALQKQVGAHHPLWSSVVVHCKDDNARLVCGRLVASSEPCAMPSLFGQ